MINKDIIKNRECRLEIIEYLMLIYDMLKKKKKIERIEEELSNKSKDFEKLVKNEKLRKENMNEISSEYVFFLNG